jgi:hypothetical protein
MIHGYLDSTHALCDCKWAWVGDEPVCLCCGRALEWEQEDRDELATPYDVELCHEGLDDV